ncbi:MAG: hypothetical protein ACW99G_20630 [Candidatus Thorarchaeota archaeon]|jgi:hypothetical protein
MTYIRVAQDVAYLEVEGRKLTVAQALAYVEVEILNLEEPSTNDDAVYTDGDTGYDGDPDVIYPGGNSGGAEGAINSMLVFPSVQVPQGATIENAYITFTASNSDSSDTVNAQLSAIDEDSPEPPTSYTEIQGKNKTTTIVNWSDIEAWLAENNYDSPSITNIIQEIVDRTGWEIGNTLIILVEDSSSSVSALRKAYSNKDTGKKPKLTIVWRATTYPIGPITLNPITNNPPLDDFTVTWSTADNATEYELQEQKNEVDWNITYSGASQTFDVNDKTPGVWSYRVRGKNGAEYGPFSSVESTGIDQSLVSTFSLGIRI